MKRIIEKSNQVNFIGSWDIESNILCDKLVEFFKNNKDLQSQGVTSGGKVLEAKSRVDISIKPNDLKKERYKIFNEFIIELYNCYKDYIEQWPFLKSFAQTIDIGSFNIGEYSKGDHFSRIHSERTSINTLRRVFAFMIYLNDVSDGGNTFFEHYNLSIKPKKGKMLIWPAEWTHAHRGEVLNEDKKYIITGWLQFPYKSN